MKLLYILPFLFSVYLFGQPNCELYKNDPLCYKACKETYKADMFSQGSHVSQHYFDSAIKNCPTLAYAYFEKSVSFLKRGYFIEWKKLIDKAIELDPKQYLFYRAWCHFFFLRNYESTIKDLERLKSLHETPFFGVGQNGDYDLRIVLALAYKMTGEKSKAISIIEEAISSEDFVAGLYDYLHLGVLYVEVNQPEKAIKSLQRQILENELAEVHYYLAKAHRQKGEIAKSIVRLKNALSLYEKDRKMHSYYYQYIDQIYRKDILDFQKSIH